MLLFLVSCSNNYDTSLKCSNCGETVAVDTKFCPQCGETILDTSNDGNNDNNDNNEQCSHSWEIATCTLPKTCSKCGETDGNALGHSWKDATCTSPKKCGTCGTTQGTTKSHNFVEEIVSDEYLCSVATNSSPAKYYYSCTFCKQPSTETFEYGCRLKDVWYYDYYVDSQFGYETDEWYINTKEYISGTFENSATDNASLFVEVLYDCNDEISIFLYEYANTSMLVKNNSPSAINYYKVVLRNEKGQTYEARGQMHPGDDRIFIIDIYHKAVFNLMQTSDNLQFYIQDEYFTSTQYRFDVDMNNFNDVLDDVLPANKHRHSYTTSIVESTCLENGYTLYSCECGDYFCTDFTPLEEHDVEHGMCTECDNVIDAYSALAYYVKCNGSLDNDGSYSISGEHQYSDTTTITYSIYTNSEASTLSFEAQEISNINVSVILLTLSNDETLHHVGMGNTSSWGTDYVYGFIDDTWGHKSSNQYIYDYTYNLVYPSQASDYKELFTSKITLLFLGIDNYVLPDFITMEMLGFLNF